ncbi:hypothetical protein [Isachenkonia alkalipeptolytica]|uniref:Uncharacterized protein n=1 Tax=Isachenkonia alkalipeptolytica TaxID=2565777 RepID=A0AA43XKB0_9CLOT|nr:hypothetical protein [Isachenkonia alkalipeptolytica]NBG87789.1 hypothetical protein [Isachenkonia alkalipeptolytica]
MEHFNQSKKEIEQILTSLPKETVIGEFSGRDSVAAILKALESPKINHILPIMSFAGTEYGNLEGLRENEERLRRRVNELYGEKKTLHPTVIFSSPKLWSVLNGRPVKSLIERYGFYTPCIGCHMYFHLLRVPMARRLGGRIISGERVSHEGKIKLNQLDASLGAYHKVLKNLGVELLFPIRDIVEGAAIEELLGWQWEEGKEHPACMYSGNYRQMDGVTDYSLEGLLTFLEEFLVPVSIALGKILIEDPDASLEKLQQPLQDWEVKL